MGAETAAVAEIDTGLLVLGLLVALVLIGIVFAYYSTHQKRRRRKSQRARYKRDRQGKTDTADGGQRDQAQR